MKRLLFKFVCAAICATGFIACKNDDTPPSASEKGEISLEISLTAGSGGLSLNAIGYEWTENDQVNMMLATENHTTAFKATENITAGKALFTANKKWPDFSKAYTVYAYKGSFTVNVTDVAVPGPDFSTTGATASHLKNSILTVAIPKEITSPAAGAETPVVQMDMKPVMSVMEFKVAAAVANLTISKIVLEAENEIFPTDGKVDITATSIGFGAITSTAKSKTATLTISGNPALDTGENYTSFYLPVAATDASGALKATVTALDDYEFTLDPISFEQGKLYSEILVVEPEEELVPWDGTTVTEPAKDPSDSNIYLITNGEELAWMAKNYNIGENNFFVGKTFLMTKDIDLNNKDWASFMIGGTNPDNNYFGGTFDGNNKRIFNFYMNVANTNSGLFRIVTGVVKNLTLVGKMVLEGDTERTHIGPICARLDGNDEGRGYVTNCHTEIEMVFAKSSYVGGLIGYVGRGSKIGIVENCTARGSLKVATGSYIGGITGYTQGTDPLGTGLNNRNGVYDCFSYMDIEVATGTATGSIGGIAGFATNASLKGCRNEGVITGYDIVGGVVGQAAGRSYTTACVNIGNITSAGVVGGVVGYNFWHATNGYGSITACYNVASITGGTQPGGIAGISHGHVEYCYWGGDSADLYGIFEEDASLTGLTNTYFEFGASSWPSSEEKGWGSDNWANLGSAPSTWPTLK